MKKLILFIIIVILLTLGGAGFYLYSAGQTPVYGVSAENITSYTFDEVQAHNTPASCYSSISGKVYDFSAWVDAHPGGAPAIKFLVCGKDATLAFSFKHGASAKATGALSKFYLGNLVETK